MPEAEILHEIMKLEDKINEILALNYKADLTMYRERIKFLKKKLKDAA